MPGKSDSTPTQVSLARRLRRKRHWTRGLFLLLGLLPLTLLLGWTMWRNHQYRPAAMENWLAAQLGVDVRIADVEHPVADQLRLTGVNLVEPERQQLLARCHEVNIHLGGRGCLVELNRMELQPQQYAAIANLIHERLLKQHRLIEPPLTVSIDELTVSGKFQEHRLHAFHADFQSAADGPQAVITFALLENTPDHIELRLARDQSLNKPQTRVELNTAAAALPCGLLLEYPQLAERLGAGATFRGRTWLQSQSAGWSGEVTGNLAGLDWSSVSRGTGHHITGPAALEIQSLKFVGGRITTAVGRVQSGPGSFSRSLTDALGRHAKIEMNGTSMQESDRESLDYGEFSFRFDLGRGPSTIQGTCQAGHEQLLNDRRGEPLVVLSEQSITSAALVRTVFDLEPNQVPFVGQSHAWVEALPRDASWGRQAIAIPDAAAK